MVFLSSKQRRQLVCDRVKEIRVQKFGEDYGAQKQMAREMGIPYTTYRGYEQNRTNDEFLRQYARKWNISFLWLMGADQIPLAEETKEGPRTVIQIDVERGIVTSGYYRVVRMPDESMEPLIHKGAWVGIATSATLENLDGSLVALRDHDGVLIRRAIIQGKTMIAISNKQHSTPFHKSDVIGRVEWQFGRI